MIMLDMGGNIEAKNPLAKQPVSNHVNFGSENWYSDQYISITKNKTLTEKWALGSGTDVVEIDLDKVSNKKIDLSTPEGREINIMGESGVKYKDKVNASRLSGMMEEGLVEGEINKKAINNRYNPKYD